MPGRHCLRALAATALAAAALPPGVAAQPLVFVPVAPCRIVDTRLPTPAPLAGGETRTFDVVGAALDYSPQGGNPNGCGIPGFAGTVPVAQALAVNVTAVDAVADGHLRVFAGGEPMPHASTVNYQALRSGPGRANLANAVIVPLRAIDEGDDIAVFATQQVHVLLDVSGYFINMSLGGGSSSGLDADLLDGLDSSADGRLAASNFWTGLNAFQGELVLGADATTRVHVFGSLESTTPLRFEGNLLDDNETALVVVEPTAPRSITLPDASGEVSLLGQAVDGSEVADVVRSLQLPLGSFRACNEADPLDGASGADLFADFSRSGSAMVIEWDAVAATPDENYGVCVAFTLPADFKDSPELRLEMAKSADSFPPEQVSLSLVNSGGSDVLPPVTIAQASPHFLTATPNDTLTVGANYTLRVAVGGQALNNLNDTVRLFGVELRYTAEQ